MLVALGCSGKDAGLSASNSPDAGPDITGKWKGKLEMPKTDEDNPFAKMGEAMAGMFTGGMTLEFPTGDSFKLTMMGMPIEGKVERKGLDLTLTAERAMGMTVEELKKSSEDFSKDKFSAKISEDGSKITLIEEGQKPEEGTMVFERAKDEPAKEVVSTVNADEKAHVGSYSAKMEGKKPDGMSEEKEQEFKMAEAMVSSASLELRADNTFTINLMFEMGGTWKVEKDEVVLHMTKMMGLSDEGSSSSNDDMKLTIGSGGRLTTDKDGPSGMTLVFTKK